MKFRIKQKKVSQKDGTKGKLKWKNKAKNMYKYGYKVKEATEEHIRWTGMKHFEHKIVTLPLSVKQKVQPRGFFCSN